MKRRAICNSVKPMAGGFVVKAVPKKLSACPHWRLATPGDDLRFFGPRDQAMVFPTHAAAVAEAKRWEAMFQPAISVEVEPA
jgi:hypothetical protein